MALEHRSDFRLSFFIQNVKKLKFKSVKNESPRAKSPRAGVLNPGTPKPAKGLSTLPPPFSVPLPSPSSELNYL